MYACYFIASFPMVYWLDEPSDDQVNQSPACITIDHNQSRAINGSGRWKGSTRRNGETYRLGRFDDEHEASRAYDAAKDEFSSTKSYKVNESYKWTIGKVIENALAAGKYCQHRRPKIDFNIDLT